MEVLARALVIFFAALVIVRIGSKCFLAKKTLRLGEAIQSVVGLAMPEGLALSGGEAG